MNRACTVSAQREVSGRWVETGRQPTSDKKGVRTKFRTPFSIYKGEPVGSSEGYCSTNWNTTTRLYSKSSEY